VTTADRLGIHAAGELKRISKGWFYRADRPGPDWYAHGTTPKTTWLLHEYGLSYEAPEDDDELLVWLAEREVAHEVQAAREEVLGDVTRRYADRSWSLATIWM
jgi:hypothetical protein